MTTTVDARGLACPLPLAMAKARMAEVEPGGTLLVLATDPDAPVDLAAWCADEGHTLAQGHEEFRITRST